MYRSFLCEFEMKERATRPTMLSSPKLKATNRASSEPNLFPPIESRHGNHDVLRTLSGSRDQHQAEVTMAHSGHPLPSRYLLYRKLGLISKGGRVARAANEDTSQQDVTSPRNISQSTSQGKLSKSQVKSEVNKRSPFSMTGHELENTRTVRKKIEEFRSWHEDQYRQKLEVLKARAAKEKNGKIRAAEALALAHIYKDKVTPLDELNTVVEKSEKHRTDKEQSLNEGKHNQTSLLEAPDACAPSLAVDSLPRLTSRGVLHTSRQDQSATDIDHRSHGGATSSPRPDSPPAPIPIDIRQRVHSAKTWRTWRNVNQSDAYNDVKAYIKENELLDGDKDKHIMNWVVSVEEARRSGQCVGIDGRVIALGAHKQEQTSSSDTR